MKKIILILMGIGMAWGIFMCQKAQAGHWESRGTTFDKGWYLVCSYEDFYNTIDISPVCMVVWNEGTQLEVDLYIEAFNGDDALDAAVFWYKYENSFWNKYIPPLKYVEDAKCEGENCG